MESYQVLSKHIADVTFLGNDFVLMPSVDKFLHDDREMIAFSKTLMPCLCVCTQR